MNNKKVSIFDFNFKDKVFLYVGKNDYSTNNYLFNDKKNKFIQDNLKKNKYQKKSFGDILQENTTDTFLIRVPVYIINTFLQDKNFNYLVEEGYRVKEREEKGFYDIML